MVSFEALQSKQEKVCIVGLGYVGLPLAVLLSKHFGVIGFDVNETRIDELQKGIDTTKEVSQADLDAAPIAYSVDPSVIAYSKFIIVAVPTPIDEQKVPDLTILKKATETVAKQLQKDAVVVYESTVYPGATEEVCVPILESVSGLKAGVDFKVGYSPERVNPGDKEHTIDKVVKVVAGMDKESSNLIAKVYGTITNTFEAASIRTAEAAKAIENSQRDLNIAFMNELAMLFGKMDISVYDVLEAAGTKWNFLKFKPGLVGGHCIGVDPYYLTHKAQEVGHHPEVILAGRGINDRMHEFVAASILEKMKDMGKDVNTAKCAILGITFKENVPDIRNSKVAELYKMLVDAGMQTLVYDPHADASEVEHEYGIKLCNKADLEHIDTLIVAVAHDEFAHMSVADLRAYMNHDNLLLVDVKRLYDRVNVEAAGIRYWTL